MRWLHGVVSAIDVVSALVLLASAYAATKRLVRVHRSGIDVADARWILVDGTLGALVLESCACGLRFIEAPGNGRGALWLVGGVLLLLLQVALRRAFESQFFSDPVNAA